MNINNKIADKNILITGGTGSFGHQIVSQLLKFSPNKIVVFSRDEKKQYDMQNEIKESFDRLQQVLRSYNQILYRNIWGSRLWRLNNA